MPCLPQLIDSCCAKTQWLLLLMSIQSTVCDMEITAQEQMHEVTLLAAQAMLSAAGSS